MPHEANNSLVSIERNGIFYGMRDVALESNTAGAVVDHIETNDGWGFINVFLDPSMI